MNLSKRSEDKELFSGERSSKENTLFYGEQSSNERKNIHYFMENE